MADQHSRATWMTSPADRLAIAGLVLSILLLAAAVIIWGIVYFA